MRTCSPSPGASRSVEETRKRCVTELIPQLGVDLASRLSLGREEVDATGGERDALLPATAGGIGDHDIATPPETGDDLAGALSGDSELSPDCQDRRSAGLRTEPKDGAAQGISGHRSRRAP